MSSERVQKLESRIWAMNNFEEKVRPFLDDEDREAVRESLERDNGTDPKVHVPQKRGPKGKKE